MNNLQDYEIGVVFNSRKALQDLNKFERTVNNKMNRINKKHIAAEKAKTTATVKGGKQRVSAEEKAAAKELKVKQRLQEAERKKRVKFDMWKLQQLRSASTARLTLEQIMNLKHLLNSKRTEEEIRAEVKKTTSVYMRENKRRAVMQKNKAKGVAVGGGVGKGAGVAALAGGMGGMIATALNPLTLAAAAATASLMSLSAGARQYKELRAGAERADVGVDFLNKLSFTTKGLGQGEEFNTDKLADMLADFDERRGELTSDLAVDKNGAFTGGEGADLANMLKNVGVVDTVEDMKKFVSGSTEEVFTRVMDTTGELVKAGKITASQARFVRESFTSDLGKLGIAFDKNSETVAQLGKSYEKLGNTITKEQEAKMNAVGNTFAQIGAVFNNFPLNVFKSFSEMLSGTALEGFKGMGEQLSRLAPILGKILGVVGNLIGVAFKPLAAILEIVIDAVSRVVDVFSSVANTLINNVTVPIANAITQVSNTIQGVLQSIFNFLDKLQEKAMSFLPSWMGGSDTKATDVRAKADSSVVKWDTSKPYTAQPVPTYNPYSYTTPPAQQSATATTATVKNDLTANVNLVVDGKVLAEVVTKQDSFKEEVNFQMYPLFAR
ncbi:hypothetical protein Q5V23_004426 [Vibrio fluvialis]|nr:hypothetical protein [Vibrio fluvialis]ELL4670532.1 hypothetical protein [Vibrio fluvialis]